MPKLTNRWVEKLEAPARGHKTYWDTEARGLGIRITAAGTRSFVYRYMIAGVERRYTIGEFGAAPRLTVSAARDEAIALRAQVRNGGDPLDIRQQKRQAETVAELFTAYEEEHALPHKRAKSVSDDRAMWSKIVKPRLGNRKVQSITRRDVASLHQSLKKTPYRANRVLALLSKMFSLAVEWEWIDRNPARGIRRFPEERRERWLNRDELRYLSGALDRYEDQRVADAIRLLMLTGARRGEVLALEWSHIDFDRAVWTKPSHHTKQNRTEHVPLSAPALQLLSRLRNTADPKVPFAFPGNAEGKPLQDIKKAWRLIKDDATLTLWRENEDAGPLVAAAVPKNQDRAPTVAEVQAVAKKRKAKLPAGLLDVRIHDLRHTYASHLVSSGLSLEIVGRLPGHTQAATTKRYAHLADDPLREATDRFGSIFEGAAGGKASAVVVPINRGSAG